MVLIIVDVTNMIEPSQASGVIRNERLGKLCIVHPGSAISSRLCGRSSCILEGDEQATGLCKQVIVLRITWIGPVNGAIFLHRQVICQQDRRFDDRWYQKVSACPYFCCGSFISQQPE